MVARRGTVRSAAELDLRLLRSFVVVAEELHFTRAASRLFVAQQRSAANPPLEPSRHALFTRSKPGA